MMASIQTRLISRLFGFSLMPYLETTSCVEYARGLFVCLFVCLFVLLQPILVETSGCLVTPQSETQENSGFI